MEKEKLEMFRKLSFVCLCLAQKNYCRLQTQVDNIIEFKKYFYNLPKEVEQNFEYLNLFCQPNYQNWFTFTKSLTDLMVYFECNRHS